MSDKPTGGRSSAGGAWGGALLAGVIILLAPWAIIILAVGFTDLSYITGTARAIQDLLVAVLQGLAFFATLVGVLVLAAGALTVRYLFHRSDGKVVRLELERRAEIALEQARQSQHPNLTSYTYSPRYDTRYAVAPPPPAPVLPAPDASPALAASAPGQLLSDLRRRGLICGNATRLTLGFAGEEGVPVQIGVASMVAIGGNPRMGKSTLAAFLLSQAALMGWPIYLCDPHGDNEQGILWRCSPIAHLFARAAVRPDEITEAVAAFDALGHGRLHGGDSDRTPALLVIDELPALALSGQLPTATMERLTRMGSQYPKVNLLMIGIGYDWSAALFGSSPYAAPLRRLTLPRVTVAADPASAGQLVGSRLAPQARELPRGRALYINHNSHGLIDVPEVQPADLANVASSCPRPPAAPPVVLEGRALEAVTGEILEAEVPLAERILAHVATAGPQTSRALADTLGADINQVCARLDELMEAGQLRRSGPRKGYVYASISHPQGG